MESGGTWGSNSLTSVNCGGTWGSSGPGITGGSIWGSGGSSKRPSGEVWSGLEADSKPEGPRWGGLTPDGSSCRPKNGSPNSSAGPSAAQDSDADHWGRSSGHCSSSSWGSTSDNKEISGWGSLDPSPVPNAGTESWGFRSGANGSQGENKSNDWKLSGDAKPSLGLERKSSNFLHPENPPGEVTLSGVQSIWNRCPSVSDSSQDAGNTEANQADPANKLQLQSAAVATMNSSAGVGLAEDSLEQEPRLTGDAISREEIIRLAVNSNEGWGKIPVRQDTAWSIDEEPKKLFLPAKLDETSADRNQRAVRDQPGSASWGQGSELPAALEKGRAGSGVWGSAGSDNAALGSAVSEAGGGDVGTELGGKTAHPSDKMLSETNWSARPPAGKDNSEWAASLGMAQNLWDSSDGARMKKPGAAESGARGASLTRSASSSSWSTEEADWPRGDFKDKVGSIWSNDSADAQNWNPGFKPTTPVPADSSFSVPPPHFGGSDFEGLVGALGNPAKQGIDMGGTSDNGKPPQMRVRLLQQLMDMGFKREDAQAALISNNLNMENTISKLLASRLRSSGMDSDSSQFPGRRQFPGASPVNDLSMLSRSDLPPDVAACLVSLMQNSPNAMPSLGQLGSHLGGAGVAAQLRSGAAGSVPPFPSNPLGMLSPNMLPASQLQSGLRSDGNQTALQHQLLQQHLLQNVQSAIQANLIPPQLITAQSLTPAVLVKVQHMMEMYQALQGLVARYQLMVQENLALLQSRQRPQNLGEIELIMTTFKQQIYSTQQQILQELTVLQPRHPPSAASGMDQLLKNFAGLQAKNGALLNPWKVGPSGDDPSGFLGQMVNSNPNLLQHSISMSGSKADNFGVDRPWMQSSASNWSCPSDLGIIGTTGRIDESGVSSSSTFSSNSTTDGAMPSVSDGGGSSLTGSEDGVTSGPQLEIAEFIPGKPWQGLSSKSAEDDPHMTPGGTTQASLVLNSDVQGASGKLGRAYSPSCSGVLGGGSVPAPGSSGFSGMPKSAISNTNLSQKVSPWSPVESSMTSDLWAKSQGVPPGILYQNKMPYQQQQQQQPTLNRGNVWSSSEQASFKPQQSNSPNLPSNWLRLRNVSPQVDLRVLEALCEQHGHLECFVPNLNRDSVIVKYVKLDEACKAQKLLNLCPPRAGQPLVAEFLNKFEVFQILQQTPPASIQSQMSKPYAGSGAGPFQMPGLAKSGPNPSRWNAGPSGAPFSAGGPGGGAAAGPWGGDEHSMYLRNSKPF